jgi:TM2 domain-containing membrane protein YozV
MADKPDDNRRLIAAILAFMLGGIGIHKFYLGQTKHGVLMLLFSWTFIPAIIALINMVQYLRMSDAEFNQKYFTKAKTA